MTQLFTNLANPQSQTSVDLSILRVNDNWLKKDATEALLRLLLKSQAIKELNISDCNIGCENSHGIILAMEEAKLSKLISFSCNYNDVDKKSVFTESMDKL